MTRVQANVRKAVKDWLAAQSVGAVVVLEVPATWKPSDGPLLLVADDGGPVRWPVKSRHAIRLTAFAVGATEAHTIVALAAGKLAESYPHVDSGMGAVLDAVDKATGARLASVLVTMHARTVEV